jgi:hypothetical protein
MLTEQEHDPPWADPPGRLYPVHMSSHQLWNRMAMCQINVIGWLVDPTIPASTLAWFRYPNILCQSDDFCHATKLLVTGKEEN